MQNIREIVGPTVGKSVYPLKAFKGRLKKQQLVKHFAREVAWFGSKDASSRLMSQSFGLSLLMKKMWSDGYSYTLLVGTQLDTAIL